MSNQEKLPDSEVAILRLIKTLNQLWPKHQLTGDAVKLYVRTLADLSPQEIDTAVAHLVATSQFYPKPAEIRETVSMLRSRANGIPDAYEAWEQVQRDLNNGVGRPHTHSAKPACHQLAQRAVQYIGGWWALSTSENSMSDRARFIDAYKEVQKRETDDQIMLPAVRDEIKRLTSNISIDRQHRIIDREDQHGKEKG